MSRFFAHACYNAEEKFNDVYMCRREIPTIFAKFYGKKVKALRIVIITVYLVFVIFILCSIYFYIPVNIEIIVKKEMFEIGDIFGASFILIIINPSVCSLSVNISKNKQTVADLRFNIHLRTGFPTRSHFGTHDGPHALNARVTRSWGGGREGARTCGSRVTGE